MFLKINSIVVLVVFSVILQLSNSGWHLVGAQEDDTPPPNVGEFEDDVETNTGEQAANNVTESVKEPSFTDPDEDPNVLKASEFAETSLAFVQPPGAKELPGGKEVKIIVGLNNKGQKDFLVDRIEAAFHYPLDYSYFIQNFTTIRYGQIIPSLREASFEYSFVPSDMLSSRTSGLAISIYYNDSDGNAYRSTVHNSTMNVYEPEEGFDGETFFLYVTLTAFLILGAVGGYHFFVTAGIRRLKAATSRVHIETGTQSNKSDIDYDWLPESALGSLNKSTGGSPKGKTSPRLRTAAVKRRSGGADD